MLALRPAIKVIMGLQAKAFALIHTKATDATIANNS
jgi:hypothetical protein